MIWLVSYPKSGNTWLRILFVLAVHGERPGLNTVARQLRQYSPWEADRRWFEPLLERGWSRAGFDDILKVRHRAQDLMRRSCGAHALVKSHNMAASVNDVPLFAEHDDERAVQIVRNPLDVTVSLMHHAGCGEEYAAHLVTSDELIVNGPAFCAWEKYGSWRSHTESWLERAPYPVQLLRFEDLVGDRHDALARAFRFAGLPTSMDTTARLLRSTAIERLQKVEEAGGFNENPSVVGVFFRQGRPGAWKSILSSSTQRKVVSHCRPLMDELGFEY